MTIRKFVNFILAYSNMQEYVAHKLFHAKYRTSELQVGCDNILLQIDLIKNALERDTRSGAFCYWQNVQNVIFTAKSSSGDLKVKAARPV